MSVSEDSFEQKNAAFMNWFIGSLSAKLNPKVALADLRTTGSGRGVGMAKFVFTSYSLVKTDEISYLVAISSLDQDELVFRIPRGSILSTETSELSTLLPADELASLDPWLVRTKLNGI
jgi:SET domain-containing protein 6